MNQYQLRRAEVFKVMEAGSMAVLFAGDLIKRSADATYPFSVNRNFFYLTGCDEDSLILILLKTSSSQKEILYIKDQNPLMEKWVGKSLKEDEAKSISGINTITPLSNYEPSLGRLMDRNGITVVYVDTERDSLNARVMEGETFGRRIHKLYPGIKVVNLNHNINALRVIKQADEITNLRKAIDITQVGVENALRHLRPGRKEYEVVADFNHSLALENSDNAFETIAASGENACTLHYVSNQKTLVDGELLLLDLGATYGHYCADISRTFPINGKFTDRQKTFYSIVLQAQQNVFDAIKPGVSMGDLNAIVKQTYGVACVEAKIIEEASQLDTVYYHGVSHFLGLDTHDVGQMDGMILKPGMVITVEPGLYSSSEGIGIRIEDDVLVTETGCEILSPNILKSIEAIESFMNQSRD
jgi:Xaa-Pro aminopeptidase